VSALATVPTAMSTAIGVTRRTSVRRLGVGVGAVASKP
jgi:hypothetical protein